MIWRVDKVVFRDLLLLTVVGTFGLTFLFSALGLYQVVTQLGFTPHIATLMTFAPTLAASLLPMTLPLSALLAAAMVFGRMRADRELLLLAASGTAPWRPFLAVIPLGLAVALAAGWGVSELGPDAYSQRHSLQRKALADLLDHPPQGPRDLRFPGDRAGASIDLSYASVHEGVYQDITILIYNDLGLLASLRARSAAIDYQRHSGMLNLTRCFEPRQFQFDPKSGSPVGTPIVGDRTELRMRFDFGADDAPSGHKAVGTGELIQRVRQEVAERDTGRGAASELTRRAGLALAGLFLPLLGALLAALVNHPNRLLAIGAGVIPAAVGYYPLMTASATLAENGTLAPVAAALLAPAAATAVSLMAAWRLTQGRWK
jgi:lipopolysaccharide export LptBFGC system permease protein LptF